MRSFRIRWPWMWTMWSGVTLTLGIVAGHGGLAQAGPVPPAGIETWDQDHATASSRPAPFAYPDEYSYEYGEHSYDSVDPEGKYGYSEMLNADAWDDAADEGDPIGQIGNAANFSHERDWENAPYEFGDGTTADVRDVAAGLTGGEQDEEAETSLAYEYGYELEAEDSNGEEMEAENNYGRSGTDFAYPEEYFYKYGYQRYDDADSEGEYGAEETLGAEEDQIGQIGNAANFSHEHDWENAPYEFGDGTTADVRDVAAVEPPAVDAWDADVSAPYEYGYGYEYSYPQEKYGYSPEVSNVDNEVEPAKVDYEAEYDFDSRYEGEPGELIDDSQWKESYAYDYAEPYDCYGENRSTAQLRAESGLELFAQHPNELLLSSDLELVQTLETLCEEPSGARRSVLNDYLEGLGFVAIDFAARFEDVTGMEMLSLADDLPGAAAFLGCFRLVEQGALGMDEAVDLLRRTLTRPSPTWIEGVREIAAEALEGRDAHPTAERRSRASASGMTANLVASLLRVGWSQLQGMCSRTAEPLAGWDCQAWIAGLQDRLAEARGDSYYEAF